MNIQQFTKKLSLKGFIGMALAVSLIGVAVVPHQTLAATLSRQLEVGARGSDVSDLQTFLARDPSIYPEGLITGYFGTLTRAAVTRFQARNGIAQVGRVGPVTLVAINAQMGGSTAGGMGTAPVIGTVVTSLSNNSATLSWNTDRPTAGIVYYSTSQINWSEASAVSAVTISGTSALANTVPATTHTVTITGLQPNTTYYYVVYVRDSFGNESVLWPTTFRTI